MSQQKTAPYRTTIGGQALIEGLMMIGPDQTALVVRLNDGRLYREMRPSKRYGKWGQYPVLRGVIRLFGQMAMGVKALSRAADLNSLEAPIQQIPDETSFGDQAYLDSPPMGRETSLANEVAKSVSKTVPKQKSTTSLERFWSLLAVAFGILCGLGLFVVLPNLIVQGCAQLLGAQGDQLHQMIGLNLMEGLIRLGILIAYIWLTTKSKAISRTWAYHGAEHKTIACYEHQAPLTVESVRKFSRLHPRCGTSFLFLVVFLSTFVFAFLGWYHPIINLMIRLICIPLVAGIAFELQRWIGAHDDVGLGKCLAKPGLWLQKLTTKEPDDSMLEVAILALESVLPSETGKDQWLGDQS